MNDTSLTPKAFSLGKTFAGGLLAAALPLMAGQAQASDYVIDTKGQHAFIQFKISHLGYSYVLGEFKDFTGTFRYDEGQPEASSVKVEVDVDSLDSAHAERDKHIKSADFLDASEYPTASFVSTGFTSSGDGAGKLTGDLTLHGETQPITIDVDHIGGGEDPWGGYRQGFEGTTTLKLADYGIDTSKLGPAAATVDMYLVVEGIRQ
ncbi:YceI family protein [Cobetia marina]|jgi:polyisoprenoid-binding protein YceI|uniref:YceI family protein n=2 Tax=Halomonadaceae TaxID=28256 RepID=A0ABU9GCN9_COBMA|nr:MULTISPECIES: YceI family protein [Cobetia]MDA5562144.1 YceI family protein [Cobetia sp. MMG027]MDH2372302.1 YceI family protein [Cobetia sp. 3AK]MDI6002086.1 YceI family protein [Cobetia pacifica]MDN2655201.1 YceI family protein [Cobetia sp. 14N.309.X.WAT.E.A4]MDO6787963.1 YceI family protein [Cobetia marina]